MHVFEWIILLLVGAVVSRRPTKIFAAQRLALVRMRDNAVIGDDAFHCLEEPLDWAEVNTR